MTDFVIHLRTVHFTLVLVCAVTIISLHGVSPGELDRAQEQMHQITQIKAQWNDWVVRWSYDQRQGLEKMGIGTGVSMPSAIYVCPETGKRWSFNMKGSPMRFLITEEGGTGDRIFADAVRKVNGDLKFYSRTDMWPFTLFEFKKFWNHSGMKVQVVQSIEPNVRFISADGTDSSVQWTSSCSEQSYSLTLELRRTDAVCSEMVLQKFPGQVFCADVSSEKLTVAVPVTLRESRIWEEPRSWLAKQYSLPISTLKFEKDFPELNRVTAQYMELPVERVAAILDAEVQRSGERVQMLGLTFSLKVLSQAAAGIIMLVQMYFVLHLKQFRLSSPHPDQIAWVATYSNEYAKFLTLATGMILPVTTCVYATSVHLSYFNGICTLISIVLAVRSAPLLWQLPNQFGSPKSANPEWPG